MANDQLRDLRITKDQSALIVTATKPPQADWPSDINENCLVVVLAMARKAIVEIMCGSENQGSANRQQAISDNAVRTVRDRPANYQKQYANSAPGDNTPAAVAAKPGRKSNNADGQDGNEHLNMKMTCAELTQKRQHRNCHWQGETVHQAESGQRDSGVVQ